MSPRRLLVLAFVLFCAAQAVATWLVDPARPEAQELQGASYFAELPAGEVAGTLMLGGFRGMAIDFLWLRAVQAKNDARYYESVALFDLISRVQPRFERVWEYMAWDMAYNIGHYVDQVDDKWSWYLAGLRSNLRGIEVNPSSERLLRHLAWMFFHKGENYMERIEQLDWQPVLADALASYQADLALPAQEHFSSFALAEYFYRLSVMVAERRGSKQPVFVRRMVPLAMDRDANRLRNRGEHYAALQRYVDALAEWQRIKEWAMNPNGYFRPDLDPSLTDESYQRNEGLLRRKMANLGQRLALQATDGQAFADAVLARDIVRCRALLADRSLWRKQIQTSRIQWLDE